jgi:hypothetical protein
MVGLVIESFTSSRPPPAAVAHLVRSADDVSPPATMSADLDVTAAVFDLMECDLMVAWFHPREESLNQPVQGTARGRVGFRLCAHGWPSLTLVFAESHRSTHADTSRMQARSKPVTSCQS